MAVEVLAGYWDLNLETRELLLCPRSQKMFGLVGSRRRPLPSYDWQPRIHPDDLLTIDGELEAAGRNDKTYCARFRTVRPDGSTCEVLGVGRATASNPKRFIGLNFDLHDATAMAQRESRNARSRMSLASTLLLGAGPANENDIRAWRVWSPIRERALNAKAAWRRPEQQILVHRAKASIARRQARKLFLNPAMFGEPPFEILLALYVRPSLSTVPLDVLSSVVGVPASVARGGYSSS